MTTKYQPCDANQYAKIAHGTEVVEPECDPRGNLLHDASRKYTWDADIHLTSVTTEGHREALRIEEPGTTGAAPGGATGSVASGQASGLPHIAPQNAPSKTTSTTPQLDTENFKLETRYVWGEDLSGSLQGAGGIGGLLSSKLEQSPTKNQELFPLLRKGSASIKLISAVASDCIGMA